MEDLSVVFEPEFDIKRHIRKLSFFSYHLTVIEQFKFSASKSCLDEIGRFNNPRVHEM